MSPFCARIVDDSYTSKSAGVVSANGTRGGRRRTEDNLTAEDWSEKMENEHACHNTGKSDLHRILEVEMPGRGEIARAAAFIPHVGIGGTGGFSERRIP